MPGTFGEKKQKSPQKREGHTITVETLTIFVTFHLR